jgi:hypothetical protein
MFWYTYILVHPTLDAGSMVCHPLVSRLIVSTWVVMCRPGLAWKPRLWPGFGRLRLTYIQAWAFCKASGWLRPGSGSSHGSWIKNTSNLLRNKNRNIFFNEQSSKAHQQSLHLRLPYFSPFFSGAAGSKKSSTSHIRLFLIGAEISASPPKSMTSTFLYMPCSSVASTSSTVLPK